MMINLLLFILPSILFGALISHLMVSRSHAKELGTWRNHYEILLTQLRTDNRELMDRILLLTDRMSEMKKHGLSALPDEEGAVWPMDNEYELEVQQERDAAKVRSIHGERLING